MIGSGIILTVILHISWGISPRLTGNPVLNPNFQGTTCRAPATVQDETWRPRGVYVQVLVSRLRYVKPKIPWKMAVWRTWRSKNSHVNYCHCRYKLGIIVRSFNHWIFGAIQVQCRIWSLFRGMIFTFINRALLRFQHGGHANTCKIVVGITSSICSAILKHKQYMCSGKSI